MQTPAKTIDHSTLRRLVDAGENVGAEAVGAAGGWTVVINYGRARQALTVTRGTPRTFRQFETLAGYLKDLGIIEYRVNTAQFQPGAALSKPADKRSTVASQRMKHAHQAAAYDMWFREQVQASIDDPQPSVADEEVREKFAAKRVALAKRAATAKKARH